MSHPSYSLLPEAQAGDSGGNDAVAGVGADDGSNLVETQKLALKTKFDQEEIDGGLRRGATSREILYKFGGHWATNASPENWSWDLSSPVERINNFFSHSWRASRWLKTLAMLCYYNLRCAVIVGLCSSAFVSALVIKGILPCQAYVHPTITPFTEHAHGGHVSILPFLCGFSSAVVVFCFGQRIRLVFEKVGLIPGGFAFLDKLSINQLNPELEQKGIECLAAFIDASDYFVMLWSTEYFTRLWCTFEAATLLYLKLQCSGTTELIILPLTMFRFYFLMCCFWLIFAITVFGGVFVSMGNMMGIYLAMACAGPLVATFAVVCVRQYISELEKMEEQLTTFTIHKAECFDEGDRIKVLATLTEWLDPVLRDTATAVSMLDAFVQDDVLNLMKRVTRNDTGRLSYRACLTMIFPYLLADSMTFVPVIADLSIVNTHHNLYAFVGNTFCFNINQDLFLIPLGIAMLFDVVSFLERRCKPTATTEPVSASPWLCNCCLLIVEVVAGMVAMFLPMTLSQMCIAASPEICWLVNIAGTLFTMLFFSGWI